MINELTLKEKIKREMIFLGFNPTLKGTKYLLECIYIIYTEGKIDGINLNSDIYPQLSKKYNKDINNIKCNINYSKEIMYKNCNVEKLNEYFTFFDNFKPSVKLIIYEILNKICNW